LAQNSQRMTCSKPYYAEQVMNRVSSKVFLTATYHMLLQA